MLCENSNRAPPQPRPLSSWNVEDLERQRLSCEPFRRHSHDQETASYRLSGKFNLFGETKKAACRSKSLHRSADAQEWWDDKCQDPKEAGKRGISTSSSMVRRFQKQQGWTLQRTTYIRVLKLICENKRMIFDTLLDKSMCTDLKCHVEEE